MLVIPEFQFPRDNLTKDLVQAAFPYSGFFPTYVWVLRNLSKLCKALDIIQLRLQ
jgi:hypothetical protein